MYQGHDAACHESCYVSHTKQWLEPSRTSTTTSGVLGWHFSRKNVPRKHVWTLVIRQLLYITCVYICVCSFFLRRWYDVTICEWMIRWMCITKVWVDVTPLSRLFSLQKLHISPVRNWLKLALWQSLSSQICRGGSLTPVRWPKKAMIWRFWRSASWHQTSGGLSPINFTQKNTEKKTYHPPLPPACRTRGPHCHKVAEFTRMWSHVLLYRTFQVWYPNSLSSRCKVVVFGHKSCGTWIWPDIKLHLRDFKAIRWALK